MFRMHHARQTIHRGDPCAALWPRVSGKKERNSGLGGAEPAPLLKDGERGTPEATKTGPWTTGAGGPKLSETCRWGGGSPPSVLTNPTARFSYYKIY